MSDQKDHLIAVLTETVETQKEVIERLEGNNTHLRDCIDHANNQYRELSELQKDQRALLRFSVFVNAIMAAVIIHTLIR